MKRIFLSVLAGLMACTMLASCARDQGIVTSAGA